MSKESNLIAKRITVPDHLYKKAMKSIKEGKYPGIRNFSGIVEKALDELLGENNDGDSKNA